MGLDRIHHRVVTIDTLPIHVAECGPSARPAILFLHGWPETWAAFAHIMDMLGHERRVVAVDLPGIGQSPSPASSNDKRALAAVVRELVKTLHLREVTLVGHDVGGQIAYAYLRAYPGELRRAVIMNVAIPGIEPWNEVVRNPAIWHFGFHAVPELPELLVYGRQSEYFDFFFNGIAADPEAVNPEARAIYTEGYRRLDALRTGFEWYRAFPQDATDNQKALRQDQTPVLYLRGAAERGIELERYVGGLRRSGLVSVQGQTIPNSGHFAPDEQPEAVAGLLRSFMNGS